MSLIDDALKRAQAADEAAARSADRPWIPTPMPDPAIARRRTLARWAGILGGVAVAAAAGAWLVARIAPEVSTRMPSGRPTEPVPAAAAAPAAVPTPDAVALATPVVVAPPVVMARARDLTPAPTRRPRPSPAAVSVAGSVEGAAVPSSPPPPPPPKPRGETAGGGRTYAGAATPGGARIELGGIVWSETEPRALLNDRILGVGSYVEGWSVATIEEDRVVLEKDGAMITITVK